MCGCVFFSLKSQTLSKKSKIRTGKRSKIREREKGKNEKRVQKERKKERKKMNGIYNLCFEERYIKKGKKEKKPAKPPKKEKCDLMFQSIDIRFALHSTPPFLPPPPTPFPPVLLGK